MPSRVIGCDRAARDRHRRHRDRNRRRGKLDVRLVLVAGDHDQHEHQDQRPDCDLDNHDARPLKVGGKSHTLTIGRGPDASCGRWGLSGIRARRHPPRTASRAF